MNRKKILRHAAYEVLKDVNVLQAHINHALWKYAFGDRGKLMLSDKEREFLQKSHQQSTALMDRQRRFCDHLRKTSSYGFDR